MTQTSCTLLLIRPLSTTARTQTILTSNTSFSFLTLFCLFFARTSILLRSTCVRRTTSSASTSFVADPRSNANCFSSRAITFNLLAFSGSSSDERDSSKIELDEDEKLRSSALVMNGWTFSGKKSFGAEARKGKERTKRRKKKRRNGRSTGGASLGGGENG